MKRRERVLFPRTSNRNAEIIWEEPPPMAVGPQVDWPTVIAKVKANPGQWAMVKECPKLNTATSYITRLKPHGLEVRVGPRGERFGIWVRYVGDE